LTPPPLGRKAGTQMTTPLPPEQQAPGGITTYLNPYTGKYTRSRSYALRMQRAYSRGLTQSEARGHRAVGGETETQRRRRQTRERTGMTPWESFGIGFQQRYGFSYRYWRRLRRLYVDEINRRASPGAKILPSHVSDIIQLYDMGWTDPMRPELRTWEAWVEVHLGERLWSTILYQDEGQSAYGNFNFNSRNSVAPIEYWYYH
jgi:hypothetical protein